MTGAWARGTVSPRMWVWAAALSASLGLVGCDSEPEPIEPDAMTGVCTMDVDCDDGRFCNGVETCAPDNPAADATGCVRASPPCVDGQRCDEATAACVSNCAVAPDADGDGVDAIECGGADCDDTNPRRYPGAVEICDDANVDEDCDPTTFGERDADADGFVDAACCNGTGDAMRCGTDCADSRRDVRPGFAETCDALDNDCDGTVDEGALVSGFVDADHDLHGDGSMALEACPGSPGFAVVGDDCDDADPARHGAQLEICDGLDNDCDGVTDEQTVAVTWYPDDDDDGFGVDSDRAVISCEPVLGFSLRASDCDDADRQRNPTSMELCNGRDDDCDGRADFMIRPGDFEDDDGDGFGDAACGADDCDDANPTVYPGAPELCDGIDNDCDGVVDGGDANASWFLDRDGDGFGDDSMPAIEDCDPQPGRVPRGGDCDDASALVRPGAADLCDGVDDDCDGEIDEDAVRSAYYEDGDGDGFGDPGGALTFRCRPGTGVADNPADCDDGQAARFPGNPEICDDLDNDCDEGVDEEAMQSWCPDADGDGHGAMAGAVVTCEPPSGYVMLCDDCDDGDGRRFPSSSERCDGVDSDCDGSTAESSAVCALEHTASAACNVSTSMCEVGACAMGFGDCDGDPLNGCEVDTRTSAPFCGSCDNRCAPADRCVASACEGSPFVQISSGGLHTLMRRAAGGMVGWGSGDAGRLGDGSATNRDLPSPSPWTFRTVDAGLQHGCGVTFGGQVVCWGEARYRLLDTTDGVDQPGGVRIAGLSDAVDVCAGTFHSCAVDAGGQVYCWGDDGAGALGRGDPHGGEHGPSLVAGLDQVVAIDCGYQFTCALRETAPGEREVWCWGRRNVGQLGDGTTNTTTGTGVPRHAVFPAGVTDIEQIDIGGNGWSVLARTASQEVYSWGRNDTGQLGLGSTLPASTPANIGLTGVLDVATSFVTSCVVRQDVTGRVVQCWGRNTSRQLGSTFLGSQQPEPGLPVVGVLGATEVAVGDTHACAIVRDDGTGTQAVYCWGEQQHGRLGNGQSTLADVHPPERVMGL